MATFGLKSFPASQYASFRPTYPEQLFGRLMKYHQGKRNVALDIGCGNGQATKPLAQYFDRVIGTDPSPGMIESARSSLATTTNIEYRVASAEDHSFIANEAVDLVCAGQAAHWFDHPSWFREMFRILRPNGTLAYWGYALQVFIGHPKATQILHEYANHPDKFGALWPPGREILDNGYRDIRIPTDLFYNEERVQDITMSRSTTIGATESYLRTWSPAHNYKIKYPEVVARKDGGHGDLVDELMDKLREAENWSDDTKIEVNWPLALILMRKR